MTEVLGRGMELVERADVNVLLPIAVLALQGAGPTTSAPAASANLATRPIASALVFTPTLLTSMPRIDLSRDAREPVAVVGFDQPTITHYYLRLDDRQYGDFSGPFGRSEAVYRRAVTVRIGVSTR
jgi:hypothetical protein